VHLCVLYGLQKKNSLISLHNINRLVFTCVIMAVCVYCAVRRMSLYIIRVNLVFKGERNYKGNIYRSLFLNDYILCEILISNFE